MLPGVTPSKFGINFIHEPVLSGAFPGNDETLFAVSAKPHVLPDATSLGICQRFRRPAPPISNLGGNFSQNIQRLALYAEDSWRVTPQLTVNYGLRYQTSFGLFEGSGRSQLRIRRS